LEAPTQAGTSFWPRLELNRPFGADIHRALRVITKSMTAEQKAQIAEAHVSLPEPCRYAPATIEEVATFEREFGSIPQDFRWFLIECGGGVIGSEWIDDIKRLSSTHRKVREAQKRGFYRLARFFPLGWDGWGNPYGYDLDTGRIVTEDYDFGGVHEVASDFYDLLRQKGLIA
jgi:hypothetical protein